MSKDSKIMDDSFTTHGGSNATTLDSNRTTAAFAISSKDNRNAPLPGNCDTSISNCMRDDVLHYILSFLDVVTILRRQVVCQQWRSIGEKVIENKANHTNNYCLELSYSSDATNSTCSKQEQLQKQQRKRRKQQQQQTSFQTKKELRDTITQYCSYRSRYFYYARRDARRQNRRRHRGDDRPLTINDEIEIIATKYGWPMGNWDISNITDCSRLFEGMTDFNEDISQWNVSHVRNMSHMFAGAISFDQDLSNWNVSNVVNMSGMFHDAQLFGAAAHSNIATGGIAKWNVAQVENMCNMFYYTMSFNDDISHWNVACVKNMGHMFHKATKFNQPIGVWNTSSVTDMNSMFSHAQSFQQDLSSWDVSRVVDMSHMFSFAVKFNSSLSWWNVLRVRDMNSMFLDAYQFNNGDCRSSSGTHDNIKDHRPSLEHETKEEQNHTRSKSSSSSLSWTTSNVQNMRYMFCNTRSFDQDISSWNVSQVRDTSSMFQNAQNFHHEKTLCGKWDLSNLPTPDHRKDMFLGCGECKSIPTGDSDETKAATKKVASFSAFHKPRRNKFLHPQFKV